LARPSEYLSNAALTSITAPVTTEPASFLVVRASTELGYDFDLANDGIVERSNVVSRNPALQMTFSSYLSDLIAIQKTSRR
jgi:hypothetical protein